MIQVYFTHLINSVDRMFGTDKSAKFKNPITPLKAVNDGKKREKITSITDGH